jgi:Ca2+/H+ antiporter, TMEM165/GDT1 family
MLAWPASRRAGHRCRGATQVDEGLLDDYARRVFDAHDENSLNKGKMMTWSIAAPAVMASFLASVVEVVEAFTIVLAVAMLRGWRPAALGTIAGLVCLAGIVLLLRPVLDRMPIASLQLVIGILLLLFGIGWLRKASLRAAGIIPLHDEDAIFVAEAAQLGQQTRLQKRNHHWVAGITALKAVLLEGLEVVFIVIAVGAGRGLLMAASLGALAACALVLAAGAIIHRPLSRVPENTLKFGVGVMLSAFGVFWTGEGLGIAWPGQDLALLLFAGLFLAAGLVGATLARRINLEVAQ